MNYISNFIKFLFPIFYRQFFLFFILTLLALVLETMSIAIIIPLIDLLSGDVDQITSNKIKFILDYFDQFHSLSHVNLVLLTVFIIFIFKNIYSIIYQVWQSLFVLKIEQYLSSKLFGNYLSRNMTFFATNHSGKLIRNMTVEIKNVTKSITSLFTLLIEGFMILIIVFLLLFVSIKVTIISFVALSSYGLIIVLYNHQKIKLLSESRAVIDAKYNKNLIDTLNSVNDVKLLDKRSFFLKIHDQIKNLYTENAKNFSIINSLPRPLLELFVISLAIIFIFYSLNVNRSPTHALQVLTLFFVAALRLLPAISRTVTSFQSLKFRYISFKILLNEFTKNSEVFSEKLVMNNKKDLNFQDNITFENVSFSYGKKEILKTQNIRIKKGEFFLLYGVSGVGKTTILNLLMGLITPSKGKILIDGINIQENIHGLRKIISYVPQHIYLLDKSIKENVAFGEKEQDVNIDRLEQSIKFAKIEDLAINNNINEYHLGEKGSKISGGQIQRIGVARALYRSPKIIILDESTNGLDYKTEKLFLEDLTKIKKDMTIIFVSHREHIKNYADNVLELKVDSL
jgi:ABC-type bacteriocin/lantibiotic exporter with double-glycine peptidase domain